MIKRRGKTAQKARSDEERRILSALDRWVMRNRKCRKLHQAVRDAEKGLRRAVSIEAWELYLVLEEHMNARYMEVVGAAIRISRQPKKSKA